MEVHFATKKLCQVLSSDKERVKAHGANVGKKIQLRLVQLAAADNLEALRNASGRCHELHGSRAGQLALDLTGNLRLVFEPTADPPPSKTDGGLEWASVTAVTVLEVTDYHGD
jgi:proteic killer suppression protein